MEEKEEKQQQNEFKWSYILADFKKEKVSDDVFFPLPRKLGHRFLKGQPWLYFLKEESSGQIKQIIAREKSSFSIYEINERKTAIKHIFSGEMDNPDKLIDWKRYPNLYFSGETFLCLFVSKLIF